MHRCKICTVDSGADNHPNLLPQIRKKTSEIFFNFKTKNPGKEM